MRSPLIAAPRTPSRIGARSFAAAAATSTPPLFKGVGGAGLDPNMVTEVPEYLSGSEKYPNIMSSDKTVSWG